jgi:hypothetical protein
VDDYAREISDLRTEIDRMVEAEEDQKEIAELQMQLEVLSALYGRARDLFERGRADPGLQRVLRLRGYGDWSLENVYAFVYESAVDLPGAGHHAFVGEIEDTDFAKLLEEPAAS